MRTERQSITLKIHVVPGSKLNQVIGLMDDGSVKIKIKNKPIEGRANKELIKVLADFFNKKESEITICSGFTSKNKNVKILGLERNDLQKKLSDLVSQEP